MADKTHIEWTDATWNPLRGCSRKSEGCRFCYAEGVAARFSGPGLPYEGLAHRVGGEARWTGKVVMAPDDVLTQPLRWKRPRRIFVNSMSDLFHENVPDAWIDQIFAVMALAPQHTFQVLTKRADRMRDYVAKAEGTVRHAARVNRLRNAKLGNPDAWITWPMPNVWLGVSIEDQKTADERVPALLATPASVRFISAEPLLGPINLQRYPTAAAEWSPDEIENDWAAFSWPDWVPEEYQKQIESFWRLEYGRGPRAWLKDMVVQGAPATGSNSIVYAMDRASRQVLGRYLHCWNNIGRVQLPDGSWICCSFGSQLNALDWVIVGGESGRKARPMHPDWPRSLRDQCKNAGVPFFFKQWGEWRQPAAAETYDTSRGNAGKPPAFIVDVQGAVHCFKESASDSGRTMIRVGKKAAGNHLEGVQHQQWPEVRA